MTGNERRIKRRIKLIVACAMFGFFTLCVVLSVQLAVMANQRSTRRALENTQNLLIQELARDQGMYEFINSERFIYEFGLRELGVGRPGSGVFR